MIYFKKTKSQLFIYEKHLLLYKFVGMFQKKGVKKVVLSKLQKCFFYYKGSSKNNFFMFFYECIDCLRPFLELKSFPGGKMMHVPFEISYKRQNFLAMKFLIESSKNFQKNKGISAFSALIEELQSIDRFEGISLKKKHLQYKLLFQSKNKIFWRNKMAPSKEILHFKNKYRNDLTNFFFKNLKTFYLLLKIYIGYVLIKYGYGGTVDTLDLGSIN